MNAVTALFFGSIVYAMAALRPGLGAWFGGILRRPSSSRPPAIIPSPDGRDTPNKHTPQIKRTFLLPYTQNAHSKHNRTIEHFLFFYTSLVLMSWTSLSFIVALSACLPSIRELNAIWSVRVRMACVWV